MDRSQTAPLVVSTVSTVDPFDLPPEFAERRVGDPISLAAFTPEQEHAIRMIIRSELGKIEAEHRQVNGGR